MRSLLQRLLNKEIAVDLWHNLVFVASNVVFEVAISGTEVDPIVFPGASGFRFRVNCIIECVPSLERELLVSQVNSMQ